MKKIIFILLIIAIIIFFVTQKDESDDMMNEASNDEMSEEASVVGSEMSEDSEGVMAEENNKEVTGVSGSYEAYSADKLAFADEGDVVIFFRASWCPSCKILDEALKASLVDIPESLVILDADYDKETELKQKYGVTTQHTLVQVDSQGEMIQKWAGGSTLESIVEKL